MSANLISPAISAEQFTELLQVSRALAVTTELDALLKRIADAACTMLSCERASIFLHDPQTNELWTKVATLSKEIRVPAGAGIVGAAFASNSLINVADPYSDPRFNPEPDRASGFRTRSLLAAPMTDVDGNAVGVVQAVNKTGQSFSDTDALLIRLLADQAGVAIQRYRLQKAAVEGAELEREMKLAREVQQAMIPAASPCIPGILCSGYTKTASITGGDAYDFWLLPDGRMAFFLGDASGHGIAPALVVSQARVLLRMLSETETDPHQIISRVNARLASDMAAGRFVTLFFGVIDSGGRLSWTSGGHGPILLQRSAGAAVEELDPPGPPVGVIDPFLADPVEPIQLEAGGRIIVLSDGLFEAFSPADEMLSTTPLIQCIEATHGPPAEVIAALQNCVTRWQEGHEPRDDQTAVVVQRTE